jgi:hypothetical protein
VAVSAAIVAIVAISTVAGAAARGGRAHAHPAATGATGATTPALPPPPNDNRDAATLLGSLPAKVTGTTLGATVETHEPASNCAKGSPG